MRVTSFPHMAWKLDTWAIKIRHLLDDKSICVTSYPGWYYVHCFKYSQKCVLHSIRELLARDAIFFNHGSESKPLFTLSKWCLQEGSATNNDAPVQAGTNPKLSHRGSATTPGTSTFPISTLFVICFN
jgi:hypothetical protein